VTPLPPIRIGLGWDRHRLVPGRDCVLGGLRLPCEVGPAGHSDGDAVLHALMDALLGAAGLDDLGTLFPDDDPRWEGASSLDLLDEVLARLRQVRMAPVSVDLVVACDRPRLAPHRASIRALVAERLGLPVDRVNLKGKTTESAGGPIETVECHAVALLRERRDEVGAD